MEQIHTLYQKRGYMDRYGGDVCISIALILMTIAITGYTNYQAVMVQAKTNWNLNRCNPIYMPFAGVIMPKPGVSSTETTVTNFSYCIKQDASSVFSIATMPFEFSMYIMIQFIDSTLSAILAFMAFIQWLKNQLGGIFAALYTKIIYFIIPLIEMIIHIRDLIAKINGIATTALFTVMNIYNTTVSGIINIMTILNNILITIIAIMLALVVLAFFLLPTPVFPLGMAMYVASLTIMTSFIIPVIVLYVMMQVFTQEVMKTSGPPAQSKPEIKKR